MSILHLDFETRSAADLKAVGLDNYARDPSTDAMCFACVFEGDDLDEPDEVTVHFPAKAEPLFLFDHVERGGLVYAHNAAFELAIWNHVLAARYGWPELKPEQMRCTMAMAYSMGLPGSLDGAAAALGIEQRKDAKGARVMLQLAKPRKVEGDTITWWDDPAKLAILYDYCKQDVEVERALHKRLMELSADEQALWLLDQRINARGIRIDRPAIEQAIDTVTAEKARLDQAMRDVTGNVVAGCTDVAQLTNWLRFRGVKVEGVAKADVTALLDGHTKGHRCPDCSGKGELSVIKQHVRRGVSSWTESCRTCQGTGRIFTPLPDDCRTALELRREAAKSSTAKLTAMRARAGSDDRMRGLFQYHGAATGRWAGRGPQPHNFPRPTILHEPAEVEDVIGHFGEPEYLRVFYGAPMELAADCLRGMIVAAPGHTFVCCDYSNIEGRVLAWLAGEEWKLEAFRDFDAGTGTDLYKLAYARAFGIKPEEVDKDQRQVGKVMELALGYGGGVGAFQTMARGYGVRVGDDRAEFFKQRWRGAHPATVRFWEALEKAAIRAVTDGGVHRAGPVAFKVKGSFLWCQLPSKRVLCYPYPQMQDNVTPWGKTVQQLTYMSVNGLTRKWERCATYGGSLAENVTQAVARDILVAGMRACEANGYPVVMHVHDEIVSEVSISAARSVDEMATLMSNAPHWANGLPIAAAGWTGSRYRKD